MIQKNDSYRLRTIPLQNYKFCHWDTVKLVRANLPANAGNFSSGPPIKRPHTQFTCVTCSLLVKTGNFTCVYAASTSRRNLHMHVILPEYSRYFTVNFTCGTHANLPTTKLYSPLIGKK